MSSFTSANTNTLRNFSIVDDESFLATMSTSMSSRSSHGLMMDARLLAGSAGSVLSSMVSQPFEVAKVKRQNFNFVQGSLSVASPNAVMTTTSISSMGPLSTLRHIVAQEGFEGAYAGLAPTMVMSIPNYVIYLVAYDEIVSHLPKHMEIPETALPVVGGAAARLLATTAVAPLELLRTRHASSSSKKSQSSKGGIWMDLKKIVRTEGFGALYRGILPSLSRDVPFAAFYMLVLERSRDMSRPILLPSSPLTAISLGHQIGFEFFNAAVAGCVAATATAPLDVIKTRMQSSSSFNESGWQTFSVILRQEGLAGLWRGNQFRMMKVAPQYAIMISCYEVGKKVFAQ